MPRKPLERSNSHYYHLTARANNKDDWFLNIIDVWRIMINELKILQLEYEVEIAEFVLMSNHFHLLLLTPKVDIDIIMYHFMKRTTLAMQKESGRINKIYGGRYKGSLIKDREYLYTVYKYICLNPVRAKIVTKAELYRFSTYYTRHKRYHCLPFELVDLFEEFSRTHLRSWINSGFANSENIVIQSGLKKTTFKPLKNKGSGKVIEFENSIA